MSRLFLTALFLITGVAHAGSNYPSLIPNGRSADEAHGGCVTCHASVFGGDARNVFGLDVQGSLASGAPDWAAVCDVDSDGDGQTNGQELGDPFCVWAVGTGPPRTTDTSKPGDAASTSSNPDGVDGAADDGEPAGGCAALGHATSSSVTAPIAILALSLMAARWTSPTVRKSALRRSSERDCRSQGAR